MKEIKVEPLSRVEGHGGITVTLKDGVVEDVMVDILEGPRLVETLVTGVTPDEDIDITCRICAICTTSHRLAAIRGLEKALGIKVDKGTEYLRELLHIGEMVESHALHVFLLALPDLLGYPSAISMVERYPEEVKMGLSLKKFGNKIMETLNARMVHGKNAVLGGFGRRPSEQELLSLRRDAPRLIPYVERVLELLAPLNLPSYWDKESVFMCLEPKEGFGFVGDTVLVSTGERKNIEEYRSLTNEITVPYSFAKRSHYHGKPFFVGSLSRLILLGDRLGGRAGEWFSKTYNEEWKKNPIYNNLAQAIETLYCLERVQTLIENTIDEKETEIQKPKRKDGEGTGGVEAPRGTLYHSYEVKDGLVSKCDIITPTAQNLDHMEVMIRKAAEALVEESDEMKTTLEMIARAYDPCISCSAHLVEIKHREQK